MGRYRLQMAVEAAAKDTLGRVPWLLAAAFAVALTVSVWQRYWA